MPKKSIKTSKRFWFKSSVAVLLTIFLLTTIYVVMRDGVQGAFDNALFYAQGGALLGLMIMGGAWIWRKIK